MMLSSAAVTNAGAKAVAVDHAVSSAAVIHAVSNAAVPASDSAGSLGLASMEELPEQLPVKVAKQCGGQHWPCAVS